MKTKPTQHAVRTLQSSGLWPDMIVARSNTPLDAKRKEKLSFFCNVKPSQVISAPDIKSIYDVPANFEKEGVGDLLCDLLSLKKKTSQTLSVQCEARKKAWNTFTQRIHTCHDEVSIAIVGKYFETGDFVLSDAYISVIEAIKFSAYAEKRKPKLTWINSEDFEVKGALSKGEVRKNLEKLKDYEGVIVPGGFGSRGIEGKIEAIRFVRENKIPYLGLCYGMQLAVIEYARHVAGIKGATSRELDEKAEHQVISIMEKQKEIVAGGRYGGSMRLGSCTAKLVKGSIVADAYKSLTAEERHRHRYEVNNAYRDILEKEGLLISGVSPDESLVEYIELPRSAHPFFVGTQAHPEFKAHPLAPHPLFTAFIRASLQNKK
jgi:CTP synthase